MFSYRHAFHAGNHADVLKHACQSILLNKFKQKNKPFIYIDTHSGAGVYALDAEMASKNKEYVGGIDKLLNINTDNSAINAYLELIRGFRAHNQYPGSPAIAAKMLREQDKLCLMEWHNNEFDNLRRNMHNDARIACHHRDGYEGVLALTPPVPARGMILIDPPYELAEDYQKVVKTVTQVQKRWAGGTIAIWYPLLAKQRDKSQRMLEALHKSQPSSLYVAELWVKPQPEELGMYGSGMAFINLPFECDQQIEAMLPELDQTLSEQPGSGYRSQWLIQPQ
ncbi:23S rRNA (adenine(2030)-N(6))-methyltransferase RlmJ [Neptunicella marina]|uniref:Ribosomal RNA large subunit methyltransferase J n=1 Tax=Neptunicella marina TaxID=2125989 RepID=A0A8J6IU90_9ALTE|nr:23S rRNA (adenine(2030)-N(6))-methyltransferase RlmJ [Neptunicella marina]